MPYEGDYFRDVDERSERAPEARAYDTSSSPQETKPSWQEVQEWFDALSPGSVLTYQRKELDISDDWSHRAAPTDTGLIRFQYEGCQRYKDPENVKANGLMVQGINQETGESISIVLRYRQAHTIPQVKMVYQRYNPNPDTEIEEYFKEPK